jgi:D-alanine-D-alanine ligase
MRAETLSGKRKTAALPTAKTVLDITVLMGGPSSEREVSLVSGAAIAVGLESRGHRVTRADISPSDASSLDRPGIDVVFIALHGEFGESGGVQELCEARGLRYTGSPPDASALAMDKDASKRTFRAAGVATPDWVVVETFAGGSQARMEALGLPVVVKPIDGGSSVDVTIAKDAAARDAAIGRLLDKYGRAMVERFVRGREFTVGVLGERTLPVLEIIPSREFYDYTAKYAADSGTRYVFDHGLGEEVVAAMETAALAAHRALGCRDMSRVDFIVPPNGRPEALEVNTIPGFTGHSLLPMAAAKSGIGFAELVSQIVNMAMRRPISRGPRRGLEHFTLECTPAGRRRGRARQGSRSSRCLRIGDAG